MVRIAKIAGSEIDGSAARYTNPVFDSSFPDPFILKFGDSFYGYSTGLTDAADLVFPLIRSHDLTNWESIGGAMRPLVPAPLHYWAPEVTYSNGTFYLYYSCGDEVNMEIRVATSTRPDGDFHDSGVRLTHEDFAIDPHVFIGSEGERYLFYATDFLTHTHIGTGTVVDRLLDWFRLEGKPRPVTRARFDWQVYDPRRAEKGNVRWHTVEGPTVIKRKGKYFQMFSGGNWQNESYGVGYAVGNDLEGIGEWEQPIDGATVRPILQSMDGRVLGPGHNSVVLGPNNRERFCVYHSWKGGHRVMSIDRMDIVGERVILLGPTVTPQRKPFAPSKALLLLESAEGKLAMKSSSPNFLLKSTFRLERPDGKINIRISTPEGSSLVSLNLGSREALFSSGLNEPVSLAYPDGISPSFYQDLGIETNEAALNLTLNEGSWLTSTVEVPPGNLKFDIEYGDAWLKNFDITEGYVDLFERGPPHETSGWSSIGGPAVLRIGSGRLEVRPEGVNPRPVVAVKGKCFGDFEFAANVCSSGMPMGSQPAYGFVLLSEADSIAAQLDILSTGTFQVRVLDDKLSDVHLPAAPFSARELQQFRFVKTDGMLRIDWEGRQVAQIKVGSQLNRMGIVSYESGVFVEMVRFVKIEQ